MLFKKAYTKLDLKEKKLSYSFSMNKKIRIAKHKYE